MNQCATRDYDKLHKRVRVGFISKFFGIFEPHGMLLDGIMNYLPRSQFIIVALSIARTDGKPLNPTINDAADGDNQNLCYRIGQFDDTRL